MLQCGVVSQNELIVIKLLKVPELGSMAEPVAPVLALPWTTPETGSSAAHPKAKAPERPTRATYGKRPRSEARTPKQPTSPPTYKAVKDYIEARQFIVATMIHCVWIVLQ